MKKIIFSCTFLCWVNFIYAQLPTGKWFVNKVEANNKTQDITHNQNQLHILDNGKYILQNFLGVEKQEGTIITNGNTWIFSDEQKGYFAVFQLLENFPEKIRLKYLPYQSDTAPMDISLLVLKEETTTKVDSTTSPAFGGTWTFEQADSQLHISLLQDNNTIFGTHCSGLNCLHEYKIIGEVSGNTAKIRLLDKNYAVLAQGNLSFEDKLLRWTVTENRDKIMTTDNILLQKK